MNANLFSVLLQGIFAQAPILLVCIVCCIVTILNWQQSPAASLWSLIGFGLNIILGICVPISSAIMQQMIRSGEVHSVPMVFTALGFFWGLLRAGSFACLLVAIYSGRPSPQPKSYPSSPPSVPQP